ncbi:MAG TPA: pantetheine-phosphate adenylyltransferase [Actinomycetales bacterium]|nr:pantetheine-phosphate adenylyltransferase [Actinomycetales bacterium]
MRTVVCPGSFDPFTYGHLDVVRRARALSDRVIVAVAQNAAKSTLFSIAERLELARITIESAQLTSVEVREAPGLLTEFCAQMGAEHIVKGLRNGADLDGELPMALMNRAISNVETLFVLGDPQLSHIASSLVKDVARHGGEIHGMVDPVVEAKVRSALAAQEEK